MFEILVATIVVKENKVLMVKETKEEVKGLLNFPAGHLEEGETLIQGALRELKEETGLQGTITNFIDTQYFTRKGKNYIVFVFKGEIEDVISDEENELDYAFYDIEYLKNNPQALRNSDLFILSIKSINNENKDVLEIIK